MIADNSRLQKRRRNVTPAAPPNSRSFFIAVVSMSWDHCSRKSAGYSPIRRRYSLRQTAERTLMATPSSRSFREDTLLDGDAHQGREASGFRLQYLAPEWRQLVHTAPVVFARDVYQTLVFHALQSRV